MIARAEISRPTRNVDVAFEPLLAEGILRDLGRLDATGEDRAPDLPLAELVDWRCSMQRSMTRPSSSRPSD
jgi:hypothetical protein